MLDLVEPSLTRTKARLSLALYHAERADPTRFVRCSPDTSHKFGYKSSRLISVSRSRDRLPARFRLVCQHHPPESSPSRKLSRVAACTSSAARSLPPQTAAFAMEIMRSSSAAGPASPVPSLPSHLVRGLATTPMGPALRDLSGNASLTTTCRPRCRCLD